MRISSRYAVFDADVGPGSTSRYIGAIRDMLKDLVRGTVLVVGVLYDRMDYRCRLETSELSDE